MKLKEQVNCLWHFELYMYVYYILYWEKKPNKSIFLSGILLFFRIYEVEKQEAEAESKRHWKVVIKFKKHFYIKMFLCCIHVVTYHVSHVLMNTKDKGLMICLPVEISDTQ